jgi:glycosyltransferase involved in cell wall biosynthesis
MRILYIFSSRLPNEKAHAYQVMKMCDAFASNHQLLLLYPHRKDSGKTVNPTSLFEYYAVKNRFPVKMLFSLDLPFLKKVGLTRIWFYLYTLTYSFRALFWVFSHRKDFDVIYSRSPFVFSLLLKIKRLLPARMVYEAHRFPKNPRSFRVKLTKRVDKLVALTKKMKSLFQEAGVAEDNIILEPDAVDLAQFNVADSMEEARAKLKISIEIQMVSFVGKFHTMGMEKGIPEIIGASVFLLKDFPDLYFFFVGGPLDREKKYRQLIQEKNLPQDRFIFLEKQPVQDVPTWLKASDILLMPHPLNTFYSFYVSPLKMFEYMASERPIVGSRLPAIEEILSHLENAMLGEPGSCEGIAENVTELLNNPELGGRISQKALQDVRYYTWKKRATRILDALSTK